MNDYGQTICLSMIVKNETAVIRRCLDSLQGFIDSWVIVDTGSSDGTQDMIREHLKDLPGELIERPWVNFAHNRSEALEYARGHGDYVFVIDADEMLAFDDGFELPRLERHLYHFMIESGGVSYYKTQLVDNSLEWSFKNVVHEYIYCPDAETEAVLEGVRTLRFPDGARARDPNTYRKDALALEQGLLDEPDNARYVFYLAQSYRDANEPELAIKNYLRRAEMGGWIEEVWYSLYQVAEVMQRRGDPWPVVMDAYLKAYQSKPDRVGPLFKLGVHYQQHRQFHLSHLYFRQAISIPYPLHDRLFIEKPIYDYLLSVEYAVACYYVGDHVNAVATNNRLLQNDDLPPESLTQIEKNRRFSLDALFPKREGAAAGDNRIIVLVAFRDPGPSLDDLVESLQHQEYQRFVALFVDDGSSEDQRNRLPEDDRFVLVRNDHASGIAAAALEALQEWAEPDDVVLPLYPHDWLQDEHSLTTVNRLMNEYGRQAFYGQHRFSSGHMGVALPAGGEDDFIAYLEQEPAVLPTGFRMSALADLLADSSSAGLRADSDGRPRGWIESLACTLMRTLGFDDVLFNEIPLMVMNLEARADQALEPSIAAAASGTAHSVGGPHTEREPRAPELHDFSPAASAAPTLGGDAG